MRYGSSLRRAPDKTAQMRSQQAFVKAAGASTQEVEQQMGGLPFERNKVRGGREATEAQAKADAAARGGGNQSNKGGGGEGTGLQIPGPGPQLFERSLSSSALHSPGLEGACRRPQHCQDCPLGAVLSHRP